MNSKNNKKLENLSLPNGFWSPLKENKNAFLVGSQLKNEYIKLAEEVLNECDIKKIAKVAISSLIRELKNPSTETNDNRTLFAKISLN